MNAVKIAGCSLLVVIWVWLCHALIVGAGGFTFRNIFLIITSGIIIFVPLWKKYFRQADK